MGGSVRQNEHRREGAIKEVPPGTDAGGMLLTRLEVSPCDTLLVP